MKQLKEIVKELDGIESAGKFTGEQCAALCADIQAIQQKIEREKNNAKQRLFV